MRTIQLSQDCPVAADGVNVVEYAKGDTAEFSDELADMLINAKIAKLVKAPNKPTTPESKTALETPKSQTK